MWGPGERAIGEYSNKSGDFWNKRCPVATSEIFGVSCTDVESTKQSKVVCSFSPTAIARLQRLFQSQNPGRRRACIVRRRIPSETRLARKLPGQLNFIRENDTPCRLLSAPFGSWEGEVRGGRSGGHDALKSRAEEVSVALIGIERWPCRYFKLQTPRCLRMVFVYSAHGSTEPDRIDCFSNAGRKELKERGLTGWSSSIHASLAPFAIACKGCGVTHARPLRLITGRQT